LSLRVRSFEAADLAACAALLAHRHSVDCAREGLGPARNPAYADPRACLEMLERFFGSGRADVVVAESGGRVVGFLAGDRQMFSPAEFASIYAEPRSISIPLHGHAVADTVDATEAYTEMYAPLATRWVTAGMFSHNAGVSADDERMLEAFYFLGFARKSVCAVRSTWDPVDAPPEDGGVRVARVSNEDEALMERFHRDLMTYQTRSPMFWPYSGEADPAVADLRTKLVESRQGLCFAAWIDDAPVGMMLLAPALFLSPLLSSVEMAYLWEGFLDPGARSKGVGSTLLARALVALRTQGHRWCALHFVAGNPLGARFWQGHGFVPCEYTMRRQVDERISWARGPA
jgi:GNAT superfamily N-acetyltransferase